MFTKEARQRALAVTIIFSLFGTIAVLLNIDKLISILPLVISYAAMVVNAYYSIRCFASLEGNNNQTQKILDASLLLLYAFMAIAIANPVIFFIVTGIMFATATLKYIMLRENSAEDKTVHRKIFIDNLGAILSLLSLSISLAGYPELAAILLSAIIVIASIFIIWIYPIYTLSGK
jgi:small-conductance mechanosensitive channel